MCKGDPSKEPVEIYRDVNFAALRQPTLEEIQDESAWWLPYHGYWGGYFGSSFEDARRALDWKRSIIARLPERTAEAEERFLSGLDGKDVGANIGSLDLGVAGAVLALSAAGCATLVSCSGHFGKGRWSSYPMIQFATDESHAPILLELAEAAGCGMTVSEQGLLEVWALSVEPILHLAELIISRSERFAELPSAFAATEDAAVVLEVHPDQGAFFEH
jgi:hypothetical protein